ncbi:Uncharacterized protein TCM_001010 [Theobroma cacao]|uniref:Uncharacterized protein n=1 Tax=Theobroma cacao TaxID=3641 RepID=A0A061DPU0_THECC|nr:Uncharacterized protein TCM_001010 [Theobroma cacao]
MGSFLFERDVKARVRNQSPTKFGLTMSNASSTGIQLAPKRKIFSSETVHKFLRAIENPYPSLFATMIRGLIYDNCIKCPCSLLQLCFAPLQPYLPKIWYSKFGIDNLLNPSNQGSDSEAQAEDTRAGGLRKSIAMLAYLYRGRSSNHEINAIV